jgi:regulator of replication initiation timing
MQSEHGQIDELQKLVADLSTENSYLKSEIPELRKAIDSLQLRVSVLEKWIDVHAKQNQK